MKDLYIDTSFLRCGYSGGIKTYITGLIQGLKQVSTRLSWHQGSDHSHKLSSTVLKFILKNFLLHSPKDFTISHATSFLFEQKRKNQIGTMFIHDVLFLKYPQFYPASGIRFHEKALKKAIVTFDSFMVPAQQTKDDLIALGIESKQIEVIPEAPDHLVQADFQSAKLLLEKAGVSGDFILTVGVLEPRKNLSTVIKAFELVKEKNGNKLSLVIVGAKGWMEKIKPSEDVIFFGNIQPKILSALYKLASFFIYCPIAEGFGLPALEALYSEKAVVASKVPSLNNAPYLEVNPYDVSSVADGIFQMLNDDKLRTKLAQDGYKFASKFSWKQTALEHVKVWEGLLNAKV
jgi:glycosyltransferase involved in cell wall biosynthesis